MLMGDIMYREEDSFKGKKRSKKNIRQDYSRMKIKKNKKKEMEIDISTNELEMLRIQGLTICKSCNYPCPLDVLTCPTCGEVYQGD